MDDKLLMILMALFFLILLFGDVVMSRKQKKFLAAKIATHNRDFIFGEISSGIDGECFQPDGFFKMHNTGSREAMGEIEYIRYSERSDYWMERES